MRLFLLTGQLSVCITAAFSLSLSTSNNLQSCITWSTVCSTLLHEHIGLSWILYLCRYDLIFPCPVTIVVKFGVTLIFCFNLSAILGKNDFVIAPFIVMSHSKKGAITKSFFLCMRFHDHSHTNPICRTPLDELSPRCKRPLTFYTRHSSMPPTGRNVQFQQESGCTSTPSPRGYWVRLKAD